MFWKIQSLMLESVRLSWFFPISFQFCSSSSEELFFLAEICSLPKNEDFQWKRFIVFVFNRHTELMSSAFTYSVFWYVIHFGFSKLSCFPATILRYFVHAFSVKRILRPRTPSPITAQLTVLISVPTFVRWIRRDVKVTRHCLWLLPTILVAFLMITLAASAVFAREARTLLFRYLFPLHPKITSRNKELFPSKVACDDINLPNIKVHTTRVQLWRRMNLRNETPTTWTIDLQAACLFDGCCSFVRLCYSECVYPLCEEASKDVAW